MWEIMPDAKFVAPASRGSVHNRGAAVDVTLADALGKLLPMPSEFDEFSERSALDYSGGDPAALANRDRLRVIMEGAGFASYSAEWWHYVDPELAGSPLLDIEPGKS
jgi:D-alanyl-D-alanine dipeptidase